MNSDDDSLLELLGHVRPAWVRDALCREYPNLNWFPARGEPLTAQKAVCGRCVVRGECYEAAVANGGEAHGIWGGVSARQRLRPNRLATVLGESLILKGEEWLATG